MKKDILKRDEFIEQIVLIIEMMSEKRQSTTFAIDGAWGVGKTFIVNELLQRLEVIQSEETDDNKYFLFTYNCWKYDYYEEPTIAIISAMLDVAEDKLENFVDSSKDILWDKVKNELESIAQEFVKNNIGVDLVGIIRDVNDKCDRKQEEKMSFDELFAFTKVLNDMRKQLREIAKEKTIILFVDELDRCLPSYSIKVLERLHHIFDKVENIIVILAIDGKQLEFSIQQIFGKSMDCENYLKKFIDFKTRLPLGEFQGDFLSKYDDYFNLFDNKEWRDKDEMLEILRNIINYSGLSIRSIEKTFHKVILIHTMLENKKMDFAISLFELTVGILDTMIILSKNKEKYNYKRFSWFSEIIDSMPFQMDQVIAPKMLQYIKEIAESSISNATINRQSCIRNDLFGRTYWYFVNVYPSTNTQFPYIEGGNYSEEIDFCKQFEKLTNTII